MTESITIYKISFFKKFFLKSFVNQFDEFFFESFDLQRWPQQVGHKNSVFADLNHHSSSPGRDDDVNDDCDGTLQHYFLLHTHTPSSKCVSKTVPPKACGILMAKSAQTFGFGWTKLNENFAWNERFTCLKEKNSLQTTLCSSSKMHLKDASLE